MPRLLTIVVIFSAILGASTVWTILAFLLQRPCGWMAVLAAVDVVIMLKIGKFPMGIKRALWAVLGTVVTIALSYWMIAATEFGAGLGLYPIESATRMGPVLAWELTRAYAGWPEIGWAVFSIALAFWWARGKG